MTEATVTRIVTVAFFVVLSICESGVHVEKNKDDVGKRGVHVGKIKHHVGKFVVDVGITVSRTKMF